MSVGALHFGIVDAPHSGIVGARLARDLLRFLATLVLLLPLGLRADYQEGLDAYQTGNYDKALGEWLEVTRSPPEEVPPGILAETFYAIAMLYWIGQGVPQDTAIAARWLQQAAEMHHAGAQTKLGYLSSSGQGVQRSDFEALKWFQMAAWQGDADAQYNLGVLYREGLGVDVNETKALEWFREAASNGDAVSAQIVAQYEAGTPVGISPSPSLLADGPSRASALQQEPPRKSPLADDPSRASALLQASWILERDPQHYTIQVIAVRDQSKLQDFAGAHPDWAPWAIYEQSLKGEPLWVLLQGDYTDVELARVAAMKFPTDIQKRDQLWVRRYLMVQDLLP